MNTMADRLNWAARASEAEEPSAWTLTPDDTWDIYGRCCWIWIATRPSYCDRGNWLAHIEARGQLAQDIDGQDLWPRYYFDLVRAKLEVEAWMKKRRQWIYARGPRL